MDFAEEMTSVSDNRHEETLACSFERSFQFLSSEQEAGEALMLLKRLVKAPCLSFFRDIHTSLVGIKHLDLDKTLSKREIMSSVVLLVSQFTKHRLGCKNSVPDCFNQFALASLVASHCLEELFEMIQKLDTIVIFDNLDSTEKMKLFVKK